MLGLVWIQVLNLHCDFVGKSVLVQILDESGDAWFDKYDASYQKYYEETFHITHFLFQATNFSGHYIDLIVSIR